MAEFVVVALREGLVERFLADGGPTKDQAHFEVNEELRKALERVPPKDLTVDLGPEIRKVAVDALYAAREANKVMEEAAAAVAAAVLAEAKILTLLTPEEAEGLFACYSGGVVEVDTLNAVTPKLEAIAGKELSPEVFSNPHLPPADGKHDTELD